ncbi:MAG: metal ABC transporter permease [Rhodospirillales bacterium]
MIIDLVVSPFLDYGFMRRALAGCLALSLGSAPVGVFLLLRRMSLTGDVMAHALLPGAAIGFLVAGLSLPAMTAGSLVAGLIVALLAGVVARTTVLKEDASLAAFYLISLASGVLIVSVRGTSVDLLHVLFGTVLALDGPAIVLTAGVASLTLFTFAFIYRALVLECVDASFLRSVSRLSSPVHLTFLFLVVLNLVAGFQALGTLMAVGLMILPAAAARFWAREVSGMIAVAMTIAFASSVTGLLLSYHFSLPSGPAIVLTAGVAYVGSVLAGPVGILAARLPRRHLEA